ncbi:hypothetical protein DL1_01860 [Thioclava dalianensis]|uniref:DUF4153 domain-containing protein n=1 Tax=Thioclava dalianensis TaxID=1185766 RepID=A0A074TLE4_9RHOB|nr:DUF4153 domain-containing protein [Thioclava dalianensis]KEP69798.1 hypothetical protein DL1_01860 [Thioclava dalianensis]SFM86012.1 protein of unknown function [Thioclava dalianensis]
MGDRVQHVIIGLLAGLFFWALQSDSLGGLSLSPRAVFGFGVAGVAFFGACLAMLGEIGLRRAALGAAGIAIAPSVLGWWAAGALDPARSVAAQMPAGVLALFVLGAVPIPFAVAYVQEGRRCLGNYPVLFAQSWMIVVRYGAAWLFVALVWLLLYLSSELLESVGINLLKELFRNTALALGLSGAILGLAMAVVTEREDMISPFLLLRLLRLLLPVVLVVVVVFLIGLALRLGREGVPGLSIGQTLIAMALAAITMISVAVERDDSEAVATRLPRNAAKALAVVLPVLVAVAVWSLAHRVAQIGWTPALVGQTVVLCVLAGYGLGYGGSVLTGRGWMARIRRVNIAMAGGLIAAAVLWLTPLIDANTIAAQSQLARYAAGEVPASRLPLYRMGRDWGRPGQEAVAQLRAKAESDPDLARALATLDPRDGQASGESDLAALRAAIAVPTGSAPIPVGLLTLIAEQARARGGNICLTGTAKRPICAVVVANFRPDHTGQDALLVVAAPGQPPVRAFSRSGDVWQFDGVTRALGGAPVDPEAVIAAIVAGDYKIVPSGLSALSVNGALLVPRMR